MHAADLYVASPEEAELKEKEKEIQEKGQEIKGISLNTSFQFQLPEGYTREQVEILLAEYYTFKVEEPVSTSWALYDTFDWRLFNKSFVLYTFENKLFLRKLFKNAIIHSAAVTSPPVFVWDFLDFAPFIN